MRLGEGGTQRKLALRQDKEKMCMRKKQQRRTTTQPQTETLNPSAGLSIRSRPTFPHALLFFLFFFFFLNFFFPFGVLYDYFGSDF
jgi:hypothetical protein